MWPVYFECKRKVIAVCSHRASAGTVGAHLLIVDTCLWNNNPHGQ
jgi:hypothetical protein